MHQRMCINSATKFWEQDARKNIRRKRTCRFLSHLIVMIFPPTRHIAPYGSVRGWVFYIILQRQWPTEDFGTFIDYFQHYFSPPDYASILHFVEGTALLLQKADMALNSPAGMTRQMFRPLSLTLFGTDDYVADVDRWLLSKLRVREQIWKWEFDNWEHHILKLPPGATNSCCKTIEILTGPQQHTWATLSIGRNGVKVQYLSQDGSKAIVRDDALFWQIQTFSTDHNV